MFTIGSDSPWFLFLGFSVAGGGQFACFEVSVVAGFDFGWCAVVELGVAPLVVPPPHPFEGGEFGLLDGALGAAGADQFGLEQPVHGLSESVDAPIVVNSRIRGLRVGA
ncbi:hypothetical protein BKA03_000528 [Demequina lutea]|uniref:Uncharacterized protein n=1 Tax=Demequina lutea TaxID=431489 RepID=A0A7Z0CH35_9MICO|nr:hypothetical protein [Demequina lutea]